jgi:hypothetical protein
LVALPDEETDGVGCSLSTSYIGAIQILERLNLALQPSVAFVDTKNGMLHLELDLFVRQRARIFDE